MQRRRRLFFNEAKRELITKRLYPISSEFYRSVRRMSDIPFDPDRAARLELEWWIIHRERSKHAPGELGRALAELQAEIYQLRVDRLLEHGRLRAEAMTIRDVKADAGSVSEADWNSIDQLLKASWRSLSQAVK